MKVEIVFKNGKKETFDGIASFNVITNEKCHETDVARAPTEGKLFEVKPLRIDRRMFKMPRADPQQEWTRQIIREAFAEVDKHPGRYGSTFYTLIPKISKKKWGGYKVIAGLEGYANDLGGLMAEWVEQALEWAQRISNGESWETICNNADTANWHRIVRWQDGYYRSVGGSRINFDWPASHVDVEWVYRSYDTIHSTVPLVVLKKK